MSDSALLIILLALPFGGSLIAAFLPTNARNAEAWLAGLIALTGLLIALSFYPLMSGNGIVRFQTEWVPALGLSFSLRMDGFAWMFAMLIVGIGMLVVLYARYYMSPEDPVPRFFSFLLAFMGSMLGIVLSGNVIQLVFFWELTSLFSFLLIGYWHHLAAARDGARMSLTITTAGGLSLLAGVLVLGHVVGSYELDQILQSGELIRQHPLYTPILVLILLGAFTKSAQFPFHFWLPHAMAAPTPVSAYLHSATMVKAGVFLLARFWPVLAGTETWFWLVGSAGMATLLLGAYIAIFQQDLKGLLAYSTISNLGLITLLLGLNSPLAAVAAIFHIMNHATFKASLFMAAGIIDHESGSRDIRRLSGLYRLMPITATLAMVAAAAMAGVPLLNGFISKEMFFTEALLVTLPVSGLDTLLPYAALLYGIFSVAYSLRFIHGAFFGPPPTDLPRIPHEPPHWMRFPVELLVLACLVVGIFPSLTIGPTLATAAQAVLGPATPTYNLSPWHGFNLPLLMSVIAMVGGVLLYLSLQRYLLSGVEGTPLIRQLAGQRMFERMLVILSWRVARPLEGLLGTRRLQPQLRLLIIVAVAAAIMTIYQHDMLPGTGALSTLDPGLTLIWIVGSICAIGAAYQAKYHRLAALILMGGAGLVTCITFVWFSAPDLALTQLLVEIVTTVLILLGLRWLPKRIPLPQSAPPLSTIFRRGGDLAIAILAGASMAAVAYAAMTRPLPDSISRFFLERAAPEGDGHNVVNVILVDFRGFDTLGEITVLGVVALTVFALLRRFRPAPESVEIPEQQRIQNAYDDASPTRQIGDTVAEYMLVPAVLMRLMFPVMATLAAFLFLRGHDLPGGGFVAGLTMAVAFIVQYMANGTRFVESHLRLHPVRWIGAGLLFAVLTGVGAWLFSHPFLTSHSSHLDLPLLGPVALPSALFFDLGVFTLVVGATALMLIALAHQSIRSALIARAAPPPEKEH